MQNIVKKEKEVEGLRDRVKERGEELMKRVEGDEDYRGKVVIEINALRDRVRELESVLEGK